jgi:phosphatidylserine decarboxylase
VSGFVERLMSWLYTSPVGRRVRPLLLESQKVHELVDWYADTSLSRRHVEYAVRTYDIDLNEVRVPDGGFASFNDFFTRELQPGARPIDRDPDVLVSPADGQLLVLPELRRDTELIVKGVAFELRQLLANDDEAALFDGGSAGIFRLYARDCHRLYFPCDGVVHAPRRIAGHYYAVTPFPGNDISHFSRNQRVVTRFDSDAFGPLAFVDIGGFCISSIVSTSTPGSHVEKGDEKGYFRYGGSTLVMLATRGALQYEPDILAASAKGDETPIKIGERVARRGSRQA